MYLTNILEKISGDGVDIFFSEPRIFIFLFFYF